MKPVNFSEKLTQTTLFSLHLSSTLIMCWLISASDYNLIRVTTIRHNTIEKEMKHIILIAVMKYFVWSTREAVYKEKHTLTIKIRRLRMISIFQDLMLERGGNNEAYRNKFWEKFDCDVIRVVNIHHYDRLNESASILNIK
jgi:hypothetical protein